MPYHRSRDRALRARSHDRSTRVPDQLAHRARSRSDSDCTCHTCATPFDGSMPRCGTGSRPCSFHDPGAPYALTPAPLLAMCPPRTAFASASQLQGDRRGVARGDAGQVGSRTAADTNRGCRWRGAPPGDTIDSPRTRRRLSLTARPTVSSPIQRSARSFATTTTCRSRRAGGSSPTIR